MYPYNVNKSNYAKEDKGTININASESLGSEKILIKPDVKLLDMIEEAIRDEQTDIEYYASLIKIVRNAEDAEIIRSIYMDEIKHKKIFSEIYYKLTGNRPPRFTVNAPQPSPILKENYAQSIFHELGGSNFYKQIYFAFLNPEIRNMIFEALTDEQNHAAKFNYLFAK